MRTIAATLPRSPMKPLDWYKKRQAQRMPIHAELMLDLLSTKSKLPVMDLVDLGKQLGIASSTTVHGGVKWLKEHGFINVNVDEKDSRCKMCLLTRKGSQYLELQNEQ